MLPKKAGEENRSGKGNPPLRFLDTPIAPLFCGKTFYIHKGIAHMRCPCAFIEIYASGFTVKYAYDKLENFSEVWYDSIKY